MTYSSSIIKYLSRLGKSNAHVNPDQKSNTGKQLGDIYLWQTASDFCKKQLKSAWALAEASELVPDKDKLRADPVGDHILHHSKKFTLTSKVTNPRRSFDKEEFMKRVGRKYKIPAAELVTISQACIKEGNPAVTLKVLEIE